MLEVPKDSYSCHAIDQIHRTVLAGMQKRVVFSPRVHSMGWFFLWIQFPWKERRENQLAGQLNAFVQPFSTPRGTFIWVLETVPRRHYLVCVRNTFRESLEIPVDSQRILAEIDRFSKYFTRICHVTWVTPQFAICKTKWAKLHEVDLSGFRNLSVIAVLSGHEYM